LLLSTTLPSPKFHSNLSKLHFVSAVNLISVGTFHHNLFTDICILLFSDAFFHTTIVVVAFASLFIPTALA
jgi:hypothetical protein